MSSKPPASKYGLIGYPLSHSFSPKYFAKKFEEENIQGEYNLYPLEAINGFMALLTSGVAGLNVTIPYKEKVIPFLDELSPEALAVGAVNTIKIENAEAKGYNSDVYGFEKSLLESFKLNEKVKALVLGSGGASKAVRYVLEKLAIPYLVISRKSETYNYQIVREKSLLKEYELIINTTPLGMAPHLSNKPDLDYDLLTRKHFLFDLIYNPDKTLFLKEGIRRNTKVKNGYDMLVYQAEKSWEIWNDKS